MATTPLRGALIVVEGGDRCGKTTQCAALLKNLLLHGINAMAIKFPDRMSETGKLIDQYLKGTTDVDDHAVHLLFSANRWESMSHIRSLLEAGTTLVVDRYAYSGAAYSAAKGLDLKWCMSPDMGLLKPDLVIYLDLDPEVAAKRADYGSERYERTDFQAAVRKHFEIVADKDWMIMDATRTQEALTSDMVLAVLNTIKNCKTTPLNDDLWKQ
ncbi:hypothetical protein BASA61_007411 [Batrachochytrium salamandrivorans]|nr:hypothetical protein BASA61_007411 [Batrachochytrium salamandrivorans]KAH9265376.1 thymidylate kinase [Batrachochytrium salamandrivorans]